MLVALRVSRLRWCSALGFTLGVTAGFCLGQVSPAEPRPAGAVPAAATQVEAPNGRRAETVKLEKVEVKSSTEDRGYDPTGMGTYEHQLRDSPFANDMVSAEAVEDDPAAMELVAELAAIATPSAVDLATGDSRLSLRGFPTPQLNNGFVRMGGLDILNTARTIVIQGALVPVLGRAAPGGIQDFQTNRPRARAGQRYQVSISSLRRRSAGFEITGPTVPKRAWHRVAAEWSRRKGPEAFAASDTRSVNSSLTWRHGAAASTLFSVDFLQLRATAAPGIPEYRRASGEKIVGPYLPLAGFNALGPEAGVRRRSLRANVILDAQPHPKIALRAGVETWWRRLEQDRFTTSLLNLATGRFEGVREPRHLEQPQRAHVGHIELTARFHALRAEHKLMLAASHTVGDYHRDERALPTAARNALPASVRNFDPAAPNYFRPPFSAETYTRVLTDRRERPRYTALELTERMGLANGRVVLTTGLRQDFVSVTVDDRRPGAKLPHLHDEADQLTHHFGINYQALPSRLLAFATASTAFNPSTRVDARTGRIQGNETTRGYEGGFKARFAPQRLEFTVSTFTFFNQDISRRNPLYDDPVFDANHTQPQLVAAGEETFTGAKLEGRWKPIAPVTVSFRGSHVRAVTTESPDLPEEVGRELTRFPPYSFSTGASYAFSKGPLKGLSLNGSGSYISGYVASYEDKQRYRKEYPGYGLVSVGASYSLRRGKHTHGVSTSVRNVLDHDFLQHQARLGAGRELVASYRLFF